MHLVQYSNGRSILEKNCLFITNISNKMEIMVEVLALYWKYLQCKAISFVILFFYWKYLNCKASICQILIFYW